MASAYSNGADAWAGGPTLVYDRLAELLVDFSSVDLAERRVLEAAMRAWGTVDLATAAIESGGMVAVRVEKIAVEFPEFSSRQLVNWRLGVAHCAPFYVSLDDDARRHVLHRSLAFLGVNSPPLVRRVIFLAATADRAR